MLWEVADVCLKGDKADGPGSLAVTIHHHHQARPSPPTLVLLDFSYTFACALNPRWGLAEARGGLQEAVRLSTGLPGLDCAGVTLWRVQLGRQTPSPSWEWQSCLSESWSVVPALSSPSLRGGGGRGGVSMGGGSARWGQCGENTATRGRSSSVVFVLVMKPHINSRVVSQFRVGILRSVCPLCLKGPSKEPNGTL